MRVRTAPPSSSPNRRRIDGLFDLPLPLPSGTIYDELGIPPDAPQEEVASVVKQANDRRTAERLQLQAAIHRVYEQVPGLAEATAQLAELRAKTGTSPKRLQQLQEQVSALERRLVAIDPKFHETRRREKEIGEEIEQLNAAKLNQPLHRRQYDEHHPPLALLKIAPATRDQFLDTPRVLLTLVRRELTRFLRARGEPVIYTSDLDRDDFRADFAPHPLLDGSAAGED